MKYFHISGCQNCQLVHWRKNLSNTKAYLCCSFLKFNGLINGIEICPAVSLIFAVVRLNCDALWWRDIVRTDIEALYLWMRRYKTILINENPMIIGQEITYFLVDWSAKSYFLTHIDIFSLLLSYAQWTIAVYCAIAHTSVVMEQAVEGVRWKWYYRLPF